MSLRTAQRREMAELRRKLTDLKRTTEKGITDVSLAAEASELLSTIKELDHEEKRDLANDAVVIRDRLNTYLRRMGKL